MGDAYAELPDVQRKVLDAMMTGCTDVEAAKRAGCTTRAIYNWRRRPKFEAALREARQGAQARTFALIQSAAPNAVKMLVRTFGNAKLPIMARVAAARTILEFSQNTVEMQDLADRVAELETPIPLKPPKPLELAASATAA